MKAIIFLCLFGFFLCGINFIKKYKSTSKIRDNYGLVVLDLSEFAEGDPIYITYNTYEGEYSYSIYYSFTDQYPSNGGPEILTDTMSCYSDSYTSHKHNRSDGFGGYYIYYTYDYYYYYEFEKPINASNKYLVMGYDLRYYHSVEYLIVDNTRFNRYITTIITVSCVVGAILIAGVIFLIVKRPSCFMDLIDKIKDAFSCCCGCDCHRTYSYNISTSNYNKPTETLIQKVPSSSPPETKEMITTNPDFTKPEPPPEEPPNNYDNYQVEQPYYLQQNQNQDYNNIPQANYAPPLDNYQNPTPENYTNYPTAPPENYPTAPPENYQNPPPNEGGYNPPYPGGENGSYQ